jgi:hypothetical protein
MKAPRAFSPSLTKEMASIQQLTAHLNWGSFIRPTVAQKHTHQVFDGRSKAVGTKVTDLNTHRHNWNCRGGVNRPNLTRHGFATQHHAGVIRSGNSNTGDDTLTGDQEAAVHKHFGDRCDLRRWPFSEPRWSFIEG